METTVNAPTVYVSQSRVDSLRRAISGQSFSNFPAIFQGFLAKGISESEIKPRENVFTFEAWKALGRYVRKGEHGVRITTFIESKSKEIDRDTGEQKLIRRPWTTTVFHISQTEPLKGGAR
jgi:N-terminal domain of anti-restriction factor ArdC